MIIAQALLFEDRLIIGEAADEQVEFDKFSFHKTILSTRFSSAFSTPDSHSLSLGSRSSKICVLNSTAPSLIVLSCERGEHLTGDVVKDESGRNSKAMPRVESVARTRYSHALRLPKR